MGKSPASQESVPVFQLPFLRRPSRLNWLVDRFTLPYRLRRDRLDLFHATDLTSVPRSGSTRVWAYVHDLIPFLFWEETRKSIPFDFAYGLESSLSRVADADLVITVSEHSRKDICRHLGLPREKVRVVYQGCDRRLAPRTSPQARLLLESRYGLDGPFLFYVGGSDYRKNLSRLVGAFAKIRERGYRGRLVLGGETFEWEIPEVASLKKEIQKRNLSDEVLLPGYIPQEDLALFYSHCDLFVFPSLYEGFGIPLVEAMRCEAVILAARSGAIPEVAGDAAVYFDAEDEDSLVEAFFETVESPSRLQELRRLGQERSQQFRWSRAIQTILELYESQAA